MKNITIKINAWVICAILLIANLVTLSLWQPWVDNSVSDRTITITGTTTIEAEADQFVFSPYYQREGSDKVVINAELSDLAKAITTKLKELGVEDSAIKTDVNAYDYSIYYGGPTNEETATLYVTVTLKDKVLAQTVQDYIVTTSPAGSITPQISFSVAKQKVLEAQAREEALADAKSKAETTANQSGAKLGKVVSITDNIYGGVTPMPWIMDAGIKSSDSSISSSAESSYSIQPGLNEYTFSINIIYELK